MNSSGYTLLDSGNFKKLEQLGPSTLIVRPCPAAIWRPSLPSSLWTQNVDGVFERTGSGDGKWSFAKKTSLSLKSDIPLKLHGITMIAKLTDFGHIGLFPEHHSSSFLADVIQKFTVTHSRPFKLLNLFAYTGAVTLLAADLGVHVTHVDASKTSVAWARVNCEASGLSQKPIRWIVEDVKKFVQREAKRGSLYDGVVLDPPSFGRGTSQEVWKIEQDLAPFLESLKAVLSNEACFWQLSSHTPGLTPVALENLLEDVILSSHRKEWSLRSFEMTIKHKDQKRILPSGACALAVKGFL